MNRTNDIPGSIWKPILPASRRCARALGAAALTLALSCIGVPLRAADAPADVQVREAWIRWLPANLPAGGYLTLANQGDQPRVLIGATSPDYARVQLHRSVTQGGLSKMVPVARITIAPHSTLNFAAQGYHLMLMQARVSIAPGDHVAVTLRFADGQDLPVSFEVRSPSGTSAADKGHAAMPDMPGMQH